MSLCMLVEDQKLKNDPKNLAPSIFSRIPQDGAQPSVIRAGQEENVETDGRGGQWRPCFFVFVSSFFLFYLLRQMGEKTGGRDLFLSRLSILSKWSLRPTSRFQVPFNISSHFFSGGAIYRDLTPELALGKDEICWCAKYRKELLLGMLICQI